MEHTLPNPDAVRVRMELYPGDIGFVIHRHGRLYAEEYGYGISFEAYVACGMYEFYKNYHPQKDRAWICEHEKTIVGFLLLMHRDTYTAQLRYFYLEKEYRGIGLGKILMDLFMDFFYSKGYKKAFLWTTHELHAAASLYTRYGFKLVEEKESTAFGKLVREQKYELFTGD